MMNNKEIQSNQRIIQIAQEFTKLGDYPDRKFTNGHFLSNKRQAFKHYTNGTKSKFIWYPSDIEVAKAHGLPDDWMLFVDLEIQSNQRIIQLAQEFTKLGTYPDKYSINRQFLNNKRQTFKHYINGTKKNRQSIWYPSDIEVAKLHGLPDDWMLTTDFEKESNQRIIELAQEFKKLGTYPSWNSPNGKFISHKRQAFKDYTNKTKTTKSIWYPSDIQIAKAHGLPDDWMLTTDFEKQSNQRTILIAQEFIKLGTYPKKKSLIGQLLQNKRQTFKYYTNGIQCNQIWYPSDIQIAKAHGLPDDWMLTTKSYDTVNLEKQSNQKVIEISKYFIDKGTYPNRYTAIVSSLNSKRQAFKHYINGTKNNKHCTWHPSDIEIAKVNGLPDDWMLRQKVESLGERRTKFILEKLNIKPTSQYRHKLCFNKLCLPFDFYFNKDNLNYFIEYNGEQHYTPIYGKEQTTKEENFKKTQTNDLIKLNFCKKNNYPLLVIPYWIKDFENLISEFLKTTNFDPNFAQPIIPNLPELN